MTDLVDAAGAAGLLGVSERTFIEWAQRSPAEGFPPAVNAAREPSEGPQYRTADIEEFGRSIAMRERAHRSDERKAGRYFTPTGATDLMARWAITSADSVIIEPSLGDGQFAAAAGRLADTRGWSGLELHACELDPATARRAVERGVIDPRYLHVGDFLAASDLPRADVVIGNPPYVRVRELDTTLRESAERAISEAMGEPMERSGSVWMPFVAKATKLLRQGGRLALVLPLDFTYVRYARPLWRFLGESFGNITVLRFQERVFPDIQQNVLILLAGERGGRTEYIEHIAHDDLSAHAHTPTHARARQISIAGVAAGERLFNHALLPDDAREALGVLDERSTPAAARVKFSIGYVAGNKKYFHPSPATIEEYDLPRTSLLPAVDSSRQLIAGGLATSTLESTARLWLPAEPLSAGERRYVSAGEADGIDMAYKCRIRSPWYRVPGVYSPDLLLTTFSDRPRLYLNDAGWVASNSVLGGRIHSGETAREIISSWYSPLTLLSTELNIHSLGGGVMVAVPREADAVRILTPEATVPLDVDELDAKLRTRDPDAAYALGAHAVKKIIGADGLEAIYDGAETLAKWRKATG